MMTSDTPAAEFGDLLTAALNGPPEPEPEPAAAPRTTAKPRAGVWWRITDPGPARRSPSFL